MIKTKQIQDVILSMAIACLALYGCNKHKSYIGSKQTSPVVTSNTDSLKNLEASYAAKTTQYTHELQKHRQKYPQYDDMYLIIDSLYSLQNNIFHQQKLLKNDIKKLATPYCDNSGFIKRLLKNNEICRPFIELKEKKLTTEEYIAILKANEQNIKDKQTYKKTLNAYNYITEADSLVAYLIFDIDSYFYFLDDNLDSKSKTVYFENKITTENNEKQYIILQQAGNVLRNIKRKHLSVEIDKNIVQIQQMLKPILNDNAIEDSVLLYKQKQQDIQAQIREQVLLKQKTK